MKEKIYNKLKESIVEILVEYIGAENPTWKQVDSELLRLPDSPTFRISTDDYFIQSTYWKQYLNIHDTIKPLKVAERSAIFSIEYKTEDGLFVKRHLTLSLNDNGDMQMAIVLIVNNNRMAEFTKTVDNNLLKDDKWAEYGGMRSKLYWELFLGA